MYSDDYYLYDENDRMVVNKGQLIDGQIRMTSSQGSTSSYDEVGNIKDATKYENGVLQRYHYEYNKENQLELIQRNSINLQSKAYDKAGRVVLERSFDTLGHLVQSNIMSFNHGVLEAQKALRQDESELSHSSYAYDKAGNLTDVETRVNKQGRDLGYTTKHHYDYERWDGYLQSSDEATYFGDDGGRSTGKSQRFYDKNGQLQDAVDEQGVNTIHYINSTLDGLKIRQDKDGRTNYLTIGGKTIGDVHRNEYGTQRLTVYGGFTPTGSQQQAQPASQYAWQRRATANQTLSGFLNRGSETSAVTPDSPQDSIGSYTVQAGDTLENIALQIYGDSSLWYLLASANGISEKNAQAGSSDQLHIGQHLSIPAVAVGQHHTNATHKVLNANQMIGDTSATVSAPLPPTPPPIPKKNHGLFSKIVAAVVAVVATVMTAGVMGALAGVSATSVGLFATGMGVLGGSLMPSIGTTLAAGFTAGFIGNIASQGVAKGLALQEDISLKGALITGLATAATAGLLRGLNGSPGYKDWVHKMDESSLSKTFNISSAAQLMEENALSQSISLALQKHQHFDWEQLAVSGLTAGLMGGTLGKKVDTTLRGLDHNTGMLSSELRALTNAGLDAAATGSQFGALDVLQDNLGNAMGSALTDKASELEQLQTTEKKQKSEQSKEEPFVLDHQLYLTDPVLDMIHPERTEKAVYQNYLAQKLSGSEGYESQNNRQENINLDNYDSVYGSKLLGFINNTPSNVNIGVGALLANDSNVIAKLK